MKNRYSETVKVKDKFGRNVKQRTKQGMLIAHLLKDNVALVVFERKGGRIQQSVRVTFNKRVASIIQGYEVIR